MLPPDVGVRISIADIKGMVVYEIIGDTQSRVQREVDRVMAHLETVGGFAMFRNPSPFGGAWIARGYVIETEKEPTQCPPQ